MYIPAEAVGKGSTNPDPVGQYPSAVDGVFHRSRYRPDPVLWATLDRHGLTVRGPAADSLGADPGQDWLREWNHGNLGADGERFTIADGYAGCGLIDAVVNDAAALR